MLFGYVFVYTVCTGHSTSSDGPVVGYSMSNQNDKTTFNFDAI